MEVKFEAKNEAF